MSQNERDIIEVDAVEVSVDEPQPKQVKKAKKAKHQYGGQIEVLSKTTVLFARCSLPGLFLFGVGTLAFGILSSENTSVTAYRVWLIIFACLTGLFVLIFIARFVLMSIMHRLMKLDPNYDKE